MLNKILAATAMPDRIDPPVVSAIKLAAVNQAELTVLYVLSGSDRAAPQLPIKDFTRPEEYGEPSHVLSTLHHRYGRYLQVYKRINFETGCGTVWKTILETADRIDADLIVLGPHQPDRKSGRRKTMISGTAQRILHSAFRPVMIANRYMSARMTAFQTIVACIDFSESCRSALTLAVRMARERQARVIALHMHGIPPLSGYSQQHYRDDVCRKADHLELFTRQIVAGFQCDHKVLGGSHPHIEILKFARESRADLLVMGSRTGNSNRRWYVGSVVEKVSLESACPVVIAPAPAI